MHRATVSDDGTIAPWTMTAHPANTPQVHALGGRHLLRYYGSGDDGLAGDPGAQAHELADACRNAGAWPDAIVPRNEVVPDPFVGVWYARWRLALEREGCPASVILCLPSFSQGRPEPEQLRAIWQTAIAEDPRHRPPMAYAGHEYCDLTVDGCWPDHTGRHVTLLESGALPRGTPVFVCEALVDAVTRGGTGPDKDQPVQDGQGRSGWDDRGKMPAARAAALLLEFRARCAHEVACIAWFADGEQPGGRWWAYRAFDTEIEATIRSTWRTADAPIPTLTPSSIPVATPPMQRKEHATMPTNVPTFNQGPTNLCWAVATQECFASAGYPVSVYDIYKQVKGVDYAPPGGTATFGELTNAVAAAAQMTAAKLKWYGVDGRVNDLAVFDQLLRDGTWFVIAGVKEGDLQAGATYGHYMVATKIDFDSDGTPEVRVVDSYSVYDGSMGRYHLDRFHQAMLDNFDANYDALAFQLS